MTMVVTSRIARALADVIVSKLTGDDVRDPEIASAILDDTTAIFDDIPRMRQWHSIK
ncbi:hypothetical protein ACWC09_52270 [Streptomyces sp. NPDC001617]